ncbi:GCN5-like 1 [Penicillium sp. DV-2018c]|nr:GCN5-like 1 [Penicillium sp. DV-2018c]KAJ5582944.1 GCN5-like 1 [Penicillium sp. DV-2018c]
MADNSTPQPNPNQNGPNPNSTTNQDPTEATDDQRQKEALAAFTATLRSVGANLEAPLRDRAANIQANAVALERQEAELAENTQRLARQKHEWVGLADEAREGLKEIGDVQNWAEMIECDLLALEDMMENVERSHRDYGSDDDQGRRYEGTGLDGDIVSVGLNGRVDTDADGKKPDQPAKSWLRWW